MAKTVAEYITGLPADKARIAKALRTAIRAAGPDLSEVVKWAEPVYESNGPVCWFKAHTAHVTLGFWRGVELMKISRRLETSGSKMAHMKIRAADEIDPSEIAKLVKAAIALNEEKGDPTKRVIGR